MVQEVKYIKDVEKLERDTRQMIRWHRRRHILSLAMRDFLTLMPVKKPTKRLAETLTRFLRTRYETESVYGNYTAPTYLCGEHQMELRVHGACDEVVKYVVYLDSAYRVDVGRSMQGHGLHDSYASALELSLPSLRAAAERYNSALRELAAASDFARPFKNGDMGHHPVAPLTDAFCWYEIQR